MIFYHIALSVFLGFTITFSLAGLFILFMKVSSYMEQKCGGWGIFFTLAVTLSLLLSVTIFISSQTT